MSLFHDRMGLPVEDWRAWAFAFQFEDRVVTQSCHKGRCGQVWISTVFTGLDMSFAGGPPLIFESMVFERKPSGWNDVVACRHGDELATLRYPSEEAALRGHRELVREFG